MSLEFIKPVYSAVKSVNGETGEVILTAEKIGAMSQEDMVVYASKEYVSQKIAEAELSGGDVDLSAYYTKSETDKAISDAISEAEMGGSDVDLTNYYTKEEVDTAISGIELTPGPEGPAGADGYTPVKGVDYFDGEPGKDGYTPVKGVDYFDGKDGADSTVPGPEGPAGADGYTPVKGTDYFTAEEIAQIEANAAAAVDLSDYATTKYVDEAVAGAGGGGGGGSASVAVDGETIIQNADGTISTTIGGSRIFVSEGLKILDYHDASGVTCKSDSNVNATIPVGVTNYDLSKTYAATVTVKNITNNTTETLTWDMYCTNPSWKEWNVPEGNNYFQYIDIYGTNFRFVVSDCATFYTTYRIIDVVFQEPNVYAYKYIDNNYLNIGSSLAVSNDGVLDTTLSNLIGNAQFNSLTQANNPSAGQGNDSATFGCDNTANKNYGFVMGTSNTISMPNAIALGQSNVISRPYSIALGEANNLGNGNWYGYVMGASNYTFSYENVYEIGHGLKATCNNNYLFGQFNDVSSVYPFMFGNGTSDSARSNAMTIDTTGNVVAAGTISGSGSDYAEYFEWTDGNPDNEDRIGLLVTLEGDKIKPASADDDILGIISGTATVLGDNAEWHWKGKYVTDNFGRIIYDNVELFEERNIMDEETGEITGRESVSLGYHDVPRINPNYDENQPYVPRSERAEWDVVGLMGKLYVQDDGAAKVGDYVAPAADGIATVASGKTNIRVMERISENIIRVLLK